MMRKRIIGKYTGSKKGPLLIAIGSMHGNEPAGYYAIDLMCKMLEVEPITNPEFAFSGKLVGIIGNIKALDKGIRFLKKDLNRCWTKEIISEIDNTDLDELQDEKQEIKEILTVIREEVKKYQPEEIYILDLHTTSSNGGIFTIVPDNNENIRMAMELNAPVILGLLKGVRGTSTEYFNHDVFGIPTFTFSFESGNHEDILSVNRAIAAMTNLMTIIGCIDAKHVENRHNVLLEEFSMNLPKLSKLLYKHEIKEGDEFKMNLGYHNFQKIKKGEFLAVDKNGKILSSYDGRILMPLYQKQGEDGFFIIKEIEYNNI